MSTVDTSPVEPAMADAGPTGGLHAAGGESPPQLDDPPTPTALTSAGAITGVRASAADCGCENGAKPLIFAIGNVGFDFGTEARRDSFRQLMPYVTVGDNELPPNPYDVVQLSDYLDNDPAESTELIWTLNLDLTPIYALEAKLSYAEDVYRKLRAALRSQALPKNDEGYISRVSIPGTLTGKTIRLFSGQRVPVVCVQPRGLYGCVGPRLFLAPSVNVDLQEVMDRCLHSINSPSSSCNGERLALVRTLTCQLLPEWSEDWLVVERERWHQFRLHTLESLAVTFQAEERYLDALQIALEAIAIEPIRETAHRIIIEIHFAEGNKASAFKHYQEYRRQLQCDLGVVPSSRMSQLVDPLLTS